MLETGCLITKIDQDLIDASTISERIYLSGACQVTVTQWVKDIRHCYFTKSTATIFLHWLPPSVQEQWRQFEAGVIAHLKEVNGQSL